MEIFFSNLSWTLTVLAAVIRDCSFSGMLGQ